MKIGSSKILNCLIFVLLSLIPWKSSEALINLTSNNFQTIFPSQRSNEQQLTPNCKYSCVSNLESALTACKKQPQTKCIINFSRGIYDFYFPQNEAAIGIDNFPNGLELNGNGSTILIHGLKGVMYFSNINNLVLRDLNIDMNRLPYSYGQVVEIGTTFINVKINPQEYPFPGGQNFTWLNVKKKKRETYKKLYQIYILKKKIEVFFFLI